MKNFLSATALLFSLIICSCNKDIRRFNEDIIGNWTWASSHSSTGTQMLSNNPSETYSLTFRTDHTFSNSSFCIIGGPTEGIFQVKRSGTDKIIILISQYGALDSFEISVDKDHLRLIEAIDSELWIHNFTKD